MLSNRPYLLRAFHQWIVDSSCTPILVIDPNHPRCKVPRQYIEDGEIVFNISPSAIRDLKITNESVDFKASFSGVIHIVSAPVQSVLAVYAEENGEGIFFDAEEEDGSITTSATPEKSQLKSIEGSSNPLSTKTKPFLKLVE